MSGREIDPHGMTLDKLLNPATIAAIAETTWNSMWANFLIFGTVSTGVIGFIMLCRLIKLMVDTIIHGYAIYSLYRFSIHLLGAIWNSVTLLLLHLGHQNKIERKTEEKKIKQENMEQKRMNNEEDRC